MTNVLRLDDRRPARHHVDDIDDDVTCDECGGHWFRLELDGPGTPGGITLAADGHVTGWAGAPVCMACGAAQNRPGPTFGPG